MLLEQVDQLESQSVRLSGELQEKRQAVDKLASYLETAKGDLKLLMAEKQELLVSRQQLQEERDSAVIRLERKLQEDQVTS